MSRACLKKEPNESVSRREEEKWAPYTYTKHSTQCTVDSLCNHTDKCIAYWSAGYGRRRQQQQQLSYDLDSSSCCSVRAPPRTRALQGGPVVGKPK